MSEQMNCRTAILDSYNIKRTQGFRYGGEIRVVNMTVRAKCVSVSIHGRYHDLANGDSVVVPPGNFTLELRLERNLHAFEAQGTSAEVEYSFYSPHTPTVVLL
jgi:hypothetical protein